MSGCSTKQFLCIYDLRAGFLSKAPVFYNIFIFLFPKVQAIKLLVRWLLGMKNNQSKSANSTLRLLSAMLVSEGDLTEQKKIRYLKSLC